LPGLVIIITSLMRLHNIICDKLIILNSNWSDEQLYQESRKLVIGIYQHTVFNEWLPLIIGTYYPCIAFIIENENSIKYLHNFIEILYYIFITVGQNFAYENSLLPETEGFNQKYNKDLNPFIFVSFAYSIFRTLHSLIPGYIT